MKPSEHARFDQGVIEGRTYEFAVFEVSRNSHNWRPSTHRFKIAFNKYTTFEEVDEKLPEYSFSLMKISDILAFPDDLEIKHLIGQYLCGNALTLLLKF